MRDLTSDDPPKTTIEKKKKRSSVTDKMFSPAEKILSAVARKLIVILDSDSDSAEVNKYWKSAPQPCIVVVPGPKGASKYIYHIRDRVSSTRGSASMAGPSYGTAPSFPTR